MTLDELADLFAISIHAKARCFASTNLTPRHRSRMNEAIQCDIRKFCDIIFPDLAKVAVSRAAVEKAKTISIDLYTKNWHDQPSFDPGRKVFHYEHKIPVRHIGALCVQEDSPSGVQRLLKTLPSVVWILKTEDRALTDRGYRSKRKDADAAYCDAGIELVEDESCS